MDDRDDVRKRIQKRVQQRKRKKAERNSGVIFAVGTFGLVGWSVTIPTLALLALGLWLDREYPGDFSWTVALMLAGITLGILNAWYWVSEHADHVADSREEENESDVD